MTEIRRLEVEIEKYSGFDLAEIKYVVEKKEKYEIRFDGKLLTGGINLLLDQIDKHDPLLLYVRLRLFENGKIIQKENFNLQPVHSDHEDEEWTVQHDSDIADELYKKRIIEMMSLL